MAAPAWRSRPRRRPAPGPPRATSPGRRWTGTASGTGTGSGRLRRRAERRAGADGAVERRGQDGHPEPAAARRHRRRRPARRLGDAFGLDPVSHRRRRRERRSRRRRRDQPAGVRAAARIRAASRATSPRARSNAFFDTRARAANPRPGRAPSLVRFAAERRRRRLPSRCRRDRASRCDTDARHAASAPFSTRRSNPTRRSCVDRTMTWDGAATAATPRRPRRAVDDVVSRRGRDGRALPRCSTCCRTRTRRRRPSTSATCGRAGRAPIVSDYTRAADSAHDDPGRRRSAGAGGDRRVGVDHRRRGRSSSSARCIWTARPAVRGRPRERRRDRAGDSAGSSPKARPATFFDTVRAARQPVDARAASVDVDYLLPDGAVLTKHYNARAEEPPDDLGRRRAFPGWALRREPPCRRRVPSTNGVPIIVERTMWWPDGRAWYEAHNSPGSTATGTRWALADGRGGRRRSTPDLRADRQHVGDRRPARVTLYFEDGDAGDDRHAAAEQPHERGDRGASSRPPTAASGRSSRVWAPTPAQIVVERAMYSNADGVIWAAGTANVATRLR